MSMRGCEPGTLSSQNGWCSDCRWRGWHRQFGEESISPQSNRALRRSTQTIARLKGEEWQRPVERLRSHNVETDFLSHHARGQLLVTLEEFAIRIESYGNAFRNLRDLQRMRHSISEEITSA